MMEKETLTPIAEGIIRGLKEAIEYMEDKNIVGVKVSEIKNIEPKEIRKKLNMSQHELSETFCLPLGKQRG